MNLKPRIGGSDKRVLGMGKSKRSERHNQEGKKEKCRTTRDLYVVFRIKPPDIKGKEKKSVVKVKSKAKRLKNG